MLKNVEIVLKNVKKTVAKNVKKMLPNNLQKNIAKMVIFQVGILLFFSLLETVTRHLPYSN